MKETTPLCRPVITDAFSQPKNEMNTISAWIAKKSVVREHGFAYRLQFRNMCFFLLNIAPVVICSSVSDREVNINLE